MPAHLIEHETTRAGRFADPPHADPIRVTPPIGHGVPIAWEYHTLLIPQGPVGAHRDEIDRSELERELAELGRLGWELMHVSFNQRIHLERDGHLMIFKRPVAGLPARERETTALSADRAGAFLPGMD
jgi:hypothetical protein